MQETFENVKLSGTEGPPKGIMPLEQIESEIKARAGLIGENIVIIGKMLIEVKNRLEHGAFTTWLHDAVNFSVSTANNFMRVAREIPLHSSLLSLPYTKALALLDLPAEQREQFAEENDVANKSTREIQRMVKEKEALKAELEQQKQAYARQEDLTQQYSEKLYIEIEQRKLAQMQLENVRNAPLEPCIVTEVVPPDDYEALKATAQNAQQRIDEAEAYAEQMEQERTKALGDLRRVTESAMQKPVSYDNPLGLEAFTDSVRAFMASVGIASSMASFFRSMNREQLATYSNLVHVIGAWASTTAAVLDEAASTTTIHVEEGAIL